MTTIQKRKILLKIQNLEQRIDELEEVRFEISTSGYASASISSGGGSRSYTRMNLGEITNTIKELKSELASYKRMLCGDSFGITHIYTVYS